MPFGVLIGLLALASNMCASVLTWEDCVKEALERNPDLAVARTSIQKAEADRTISRSDRRPQIQGSVGGTRVGREAQEDADSYSYGVSADQLLYDGGKTRAGVAQADESLRLAQRRYALASAAARLRLRTAYVGLSKAQEQVGLNELILMRRKQNTELIQLRYEGGREHRGSLLTAQAKEAQAAFEAAQARRSLDAARMALGEALGRGDGMGLHSGGPVEPVAVTGSVAVVAMPSEVPDLNELVVSTPALGERASQLNLARAGVDAARAGFFPTVQASGGAGRSAADWPPNQDEWSAGIRMSLPLFEGGRTRSNLKKAKAELRGAEENLRSGRNGIVLDLYRSWVDLQDAVGSVGVREKFLAAAQERADIAAEQYSTGLISFDNWIIIEDDFVSARRALLDARAQAAVADASWVYARGGTLESN